MVSNITWDWEVQWWWHYTKWDSVVRLLLRHGASVRLRNWNGVTSLGVAALSGNAKIVKTLIDAGQLKSDFFTRPKYFFDCRIGN